MTTVFIPHLRSRARSLGVLLALTLVASVSAKTKFQVEEATIADIQQAILNKQVTATEVVELYLARIKAYNGPAVVETYGLLGPIKTIPHAKGINALSTLNLRPAHRKAWGFDDRKARSMTDLVDNDPNMPDALEVAAKLDAEFAKTGKLVGPLHGVVMAFKDQYDTFDMRTTSGADAFYANDRPPHDSTFVARLRAAGAIILAKANLAEYADGLPRSSFGGTFANPYDTERNPGISSAGSGSSVGANLVTCAIAEETGSSIRGPAHMNNSVGIAPTQELVPRTGMIQMGINTRVGPIARTVEDAARILSVIAGYDPKDPLTAFGVGRLPDQPYETYTHETSLKGLRIGVVREYMDKSKFSKADEENIDLVSKAVEELKKLGATVIDPGEGGELFTKYIRELNPMLMNSAYVKQNPDAFPVDADGKPKGDFIATLVEYAVDPSKAPGKFTLRDLGGNGTPAATTAGGAEAPAARAATTNNNGEGRYTLNLYLRERGDANIKSVTDLYTQANFFTDQNFANQKSTLENTDKIKVLDTAARMQRRFAVQQIILQAYADMNLDAVVYPTSNIPPGKIGAPAEPPVNGRSAVWSFLGQQGFPVITVPAGFTTVVYDRIHDPKSPPPPAGWARGGGGGGGGASAGGYTEPTVMVGPTPAKLPVGMDIVGRPFGEPTILKIAAAYEKATHHRTPPPDFGPLPPASAKAIARN
jgi:Asp-tRNA(Asn)/Glu-tRNA(Gln) amidotransferase A subunit family amidase